MISWLRHAEYALAIKELTLQGTRLPSSDPTVQDARKAMMFARNACLALPCKKVVPEMERLIEEMAAPEVLVGRLKTKLDSLILGVLDELNSHKFLYVPQPSVDLCESTQPFGSIVSRKFPLLAFDISEGAKCLGLGRSTACVFHMMRIMEYAVQRFGTKLKLRSSHLPRLRDASWHEILVEVNKAIHPMPRGAKKTRYAAAAAHLDHVRIAWRNETMHPKATYTIEEAKAIWDGVNAFMRSFVKVV